MRLFGCRNIIESRFLPLYADGDEAGHSEDDDDQLDDLLACLGEEEQRVERLKAKLLELGFNPEPLLATDLQRDSEDDLT